MNEREPLPYDQQQFVHDVLMAFYEADSQGELWWRFDDGRISFYVNCNDFFGPGSDGEKITPENLPVLVQAYADDPIYGDLLFAARVRGVRPWQRKIEKMSDEERRRFEAVGATGFGWPS